MHATRRHWMVVSFGLSFSVLAVLLDRPALVFGTVGVACWSLVRSVSFASELRRQVEETTVTQTPARDSVRTDTPLSVSVDVEGPRDTRLDLGVESRPPLSSRRASAAARTATLGADEATATTTYSVTVPTAGTVSFRPPVLESTDELGLFTARWVGDDEPTVTVTQRTPRNVHVGRGGKMAQTRYGNQQAERNTSGQATAEIREYTTGDSLRHVDWNATARFSYPHVREYENEADRKVVIFIDRRPSVGNGRPGETQFAYLREVALTLVEEANERSDSVALYAVGRDGIAARHPFRSTPTHYAAIRETLYSLGPEGSEGGADGKRVEERATTERMSGSVASRRRKTLRGDDSAFAARLRPFLTNATGAGANATPLRSTVERGLTRHAENVSAVVLTSDAHRHEVRDCVRHASQQATWANAFLAPRVLFDPTDLTDLDETYGRYVSFERFRRKLGAYPRVSAFEVGPGDRLETVLSSAREARV
ncbi:DUF58 domain-containing protein (plasmid) [Haladaptatus sp. SPP-AMP-3]|uniref:DUF58 domain-containing protein n=1 Tax=Haladaptatus sp. SPP-AMP-3 TaxID=3121295 RepID=UPI003C2CC1E6